MGDGASQLETRSRKNSDASVYSSTLTGTSEIGDNTARIPESDEMALNKYPEEELLTRIRRNYDLILKKVPQASDKRITVEDRKNVRAATENLRDEAVQMLGVMLELRRELAAKEEEVNRQRLKEPKTGTVHAETSPISYSSALAKKKAPTYAVAVEPHREGQSSDETRKILREKIDPKSAKISISAIRGGRNGTVIVECAGKDDADRLKNSIATEAAGELKSSEIKKPWPRMVLSRIDKEDAENLLEVLISNNEELVAARGGEERFRGEVREKYRFGGRGNDTTVSVVYEVNPSLRRKLLEQPLKLTWQRVWAEDHISLIQCFQCYGFGHRASSCSVKEQICGKCGGEHKYETCKAATPQCVVCTRSNAEKRRSLDTRHDAKSQRCPTMLRLRSSIKNNIDYYGD